MSISELEPREQASGTSACADLGSFAGRFGLVLAFLGFVTFLYFLCSSGRVRTMDEVSAAFQTESLATHGTTAIPQALRADLFYGTLDRFKRPQSPYPPGQAAALVPWYEVGQFLARHLPGVPKGVHDIVSDFFLTGESAFFCALAAAFSLWIFLKLGISPRVSVLSAGMVALATPLAAYSGWLFSEPVATALLVGATAVLLGQSQDVPLSAGDALVAGLLLGAAVWVRPTHVIILPVFLAAIFIRDHREGWGPAFALTLATGVGIGLLLWRNAYLHGNWFEFGYPVAAEGGKALNTFETPFLTGLFGFLASPGKSVFLFCPPILLAMAGLPRLWRRDRGLAFVAAGAPVAYLLFFSTYTQWEGGYCYGPRYLVPALILLCLGIGPALEAMVSNAGEAAHKLRILAIAVFVAGFLVQAVGTTTSFLEADVAGGYYDAHYDYRMDFSPLTTQLHLLANYAVSAPAPIGRGFDKWWVFLGKAGVPTGTLLLIAGVLLASVAGCAWWLLNAVREETVAFSAPENPRAA